MHKAERQLSDADTMAILKKGDHGTLSVQGDDSCPMPPSPVIVDDKLYIHSAPYGYKIECLKRDSKCCFSAIISAEIIPSKITAAFESVVMTGTAVFVEDRAEKQAALEAFVTQKHQGYEEIKTQDDREMFANRFLVIPISKRTLQEFRGVVQGRPQKSAPYEE